MTSQRRRLMAVWLVAVVPLAALTLAADVAHSPRDDPDPARQRPGFLDAVGHPTLAPELAPNVPRSGHLTVAFFTRRDDAASVCRQVGNDRRLRSKATLAVVAPVPVRCPPAVTAPADTDGSLARAFGMRRPRDGGYPVGYAVIDTAGRIRYRTLDPNLTADLKEVATILRALS